jgi:hypothetical protein
MKLSHYYSILCMIPAKVFIPLRKVLPTKELSARSGPDVGFRAGVPRLGKVDSDLYQGTTLQAAEKLDYARFEGAHLQSLP